MTDVDALLEGPVILHEGDAFERVYALLREEWVARHGHPPDWAVALVELRPARLFSHVSLPAPD